MTGWRSGSMSRTGPSRSPPLRSVSPEPYDKVFLLLKRVADASRCPGSLHRVPRPGRRNAGTGDVPAGLATACPGHRPVARPGPAHPGRPDPVSLDLQLSGDRLGNRGAGRGPLAAT